MFQIMVARFRQVSQDGEYIRDHFAYRAGGTGPLPVDGEMVELHVPGIENPNLVAVRDEDGLTIGWSCHSVGSNVSPTPQAPAPAQPEPSIVSEIAVASASADVIRVDFRLKRRAA